jgi:ligand-binding SRPBCC domain-containing protein
MTTLLLETRIAAPPDVVFDAARDMDLHVASTARTNERVIGGVVHGLIGLGEEVTFEARHLGLRVSGTFRVTEYDRPHRFVDERVRGFLAAVRHEHLFAADGTGTRMTDRFTYRLPFGPFGRVADALAVRRHLQRLLHDRADFLRRHLEGQAA